MLLNSQFYDLVSLNKEAVAHICQIFESGAATALTHTRSAFARDDRKAMAQHLHALKGMCLNLGAEDLATTAIELEEMAPHATKKDIAAALKAMEKLLADTQKDMHQALN